MPVSLTGFGSATPVSLTGFGGVTVVIKGVLGGGDLSRYVERESLDIQSAMGKRMDTLRMTLFDDSGVLNIPQRAELIIYDFPPGALPPNWQGGAPIIDPPLANSAPLFYAWDGMSTWDTSSTSPFWWDTMPPQTLANTPSSWTPRLFGGYIATADYHLLGGAQREIQITAQDYTIRDKFTVVNKAYGADAQHPSGWTDQQIVRDIFYTYRPDIDVVNVSQALSGVMPTISFPTHTIEQMLERVVKVTNAVYRVDYYKRLSYGPLGFVPAPYAISDQPDGNASIGCEQIHFTPDGTALVNRVWVVGATFSGPAQTYTVPGANGTTYAFPLPSRLLNALAVSVSVNGVDQGPTGQLGRDGTLDAPSQWQVKVLIGGSPPVVAFQTPPPSGASIALTGQFTYPLIRVATDQGKVAAAGGLIFEKVVRDRRIDSIAMADQVAHTHLALQGSAVGSGSCVVKRRGVGGNLFQPGQSLSITHRALFAGGILGAAGATLAAYINTLQTRLTADTGEPFELAIGFIDRPSLGDEDILALMSNEQSRLNAAVEQPDINAIIQDVRGVSDLMAAAAETVTATSLTGPYNWDAAGVNWGYFTWG